MSQAIARSLRWCITVELVLFLPLGALSLYSLLLSLLKGGTAALNHGGLYQAAVLTVCIILGGACWTLWRGKASGRIWALAASAINLIGCVWAGHAASLPALFGLAGLVVFSRRDAVKQITAKTAKAPRVKGDGTSRLVDAIATAVQVLGVWYGLTWWDRWAYAQGLPVDRGGGLRLLEIVVVGLFLTAAHEFGHTIAGWAFHRKLRAFIVGPFQWRVCDGRWTFQFQSAGWLGGGGAGLVSPSAEFRFGQEIWVLLAGPLMNLLVGLAAVWAAFTAANRPWEQTWRLLALMGTLSLISFVVNLIPLRPESAYSDGARIYQLLRGGSWVEIRRIQTMAAATTVSELRPRDYDIHAIQQAISSQPQGMDGLLLRLYAHTYHLDRDQFAEALEALASAEAFCNQEALNIPAELHTTFVFGYAFLRKDAVKARFWWDRMETRQPSPYNADYWIAKAALLWSENHLEEASQAWAKGNDQALKLPAAGSYEFDRRCFRQLRQVLESSVLSVGEARWTAKAASPEGDRDHDKAENEAHHADLQQLAGAGSSPELSPA